MRPLRREAVSGVSVHSGVRTRSTPWVSIWSTGVSRIGAQYFVSVIAHCARCLAFFHWPPFASTWASAISPKEGFPALGAWTAACLAMRLSPRGVDAHCVTHKLTSSRVFSMS
jgi:hypothetical protein